MAPAAKQPSFLFFTWAFELRSRLPIHAIVRLKNINLSFGAEPIFDSAELVIETIERVCLVGRNGQGKSTLMRLLLGTLKPDEGEVWRKPMPRSLMCHRMYPKAQLGACAIYWSRRAPERSNSYAHMRPSRGNSMSIQPRYVRKPRSITNPD